MNCDLARTEMIAYVKGELNAESKKRFEEHLAMCPDCRRELEQARAVLERTEAASDATIVKAVQETIQTAIDSSASDIHFESQSDDSLVVRYRIDGVLHQVQHIFPVNRQAVLNRLKIMADMNLAEQRIPQDGRIPITLGKRDYDLRAHCAPFMYGEGIVLRILDRSNVLLGLDKLGFDEETLANLRHVIGQPWGLFIISGPTGSGKTTTANSILLELNSEAHKIITIEDPVEYALKGANQSNLHKKAGWTFPTALRSFLRSDPDIIFVGDTRDRETAGLSMEAAITGHLVITTLVPPTAIEVIQRLRAMGIEDVLIGGSMIGVLCQKLVRKCCMKCKKKVDIDPEEPALKFLGITGDDLKSHSIMRGEGCEACRNTGYKGRTGVFEQLTVDRELSVLISNGSSLDEIEKAALAKGFRTMTDDARRKVLDGITTPEEAFRVLAYSF